MIHFGFVANLGHQEYNDNEQEEKKPAGKAAPCCQEFGAHNRASTKATLHGRSSWKGWTSSKQQVEVRHCDAL